MRGCRIVEMKWMRISCGVKRGRCSGTYGCGGGVWRENHQNYDKIEPFGCGFSLVYFIGCDGEIRGRMQWGSDFLWII
jgi:hypothetical protein